MSSRANTEAEASSTRGRFPALVELNGKQKRFLRGLGHSLSAVVQMGKGGLDDGVVRAVNAALEQHELVKVKLGPETPEDRHEVATALADRTGGSIAQVLGRTILIYKRHPKKPTLVLPNK